ncbi:MAG: AAA domain-containing protein [Firmicutes bacterium]|nr:AAA domain-containing protein [Bacillota bacterium]
MKTQTQNINQLLIDGSKKYYDYLTETGKGVILFDVVGIERVFEDAGKKCLYRLRLDKKLKILDNMTVQVREKNYLPNHVKMILWDEDKRDLVIQVINKQAKEELAGLEDFELKDVKIVLDLKYLVARTGKWFESHEIIIPDNPMVAPTIEPFDGMSQSQEDAANFCLSRGFSYVWGAPGTGKTKYVLTNAVLNLFRAGQKVLIVAPTNNAVDQAIAAVIDCFDRHGIDRHNIFRLGMPSKAFADKYPEVLEIRGVSQIVYAIVKQKELLEDIVNYKTERETMAEVVRVLQDKTDPHGKVSRAAQEMLRNMEQEFAEKERLYAAYEHDGLDALKQQIAELNEQLSETESQTAAGRMNTLSVVGCTIDGYIGAFSTSYADDETTEKPFSFDHIFLDEAGYCCLAKAATLFSNGTPITFLGDHFQLPPVCEIDDDLIEGSEYKEVFVWAQSALHLADLVADGAETEYLRYVRKMAPAFKNLPKANLTETYRFGANLLDILCKSVYRTELKSCAGKGGIIIEVIHAPRRTLTEKKRANPDEADAIKDYLRKNFVHLDSAAVLAPYKNQVSLLRKNCYRFVGDNILTVHGSQGREWDTVILSVCDTTDKYFTDSFNARSNGKLILNTAVSRVKKRLVIVCDENYWSRQNGQLLCELVRNKNS